MTKASRPIGDPETGAARQAALEDRHLSGFYWVFGPLATAAGAGAIVARFCSNISAAV
jgi:hypothetical protein